MNYRILESEKPIGEKAVWEFEKEFNIQLPKDYRLHLLQHNGGRPEPSCFSFIEKGKETDACVHFFFAIYDGKYDNLEVITRLFKTESKRMPSNIFPIAGEQTGNVICISCSGEDYGYIYFWDHENEVDYSVSNDSDYSNLYLISKSFSEFMENLFD